MGYGRGIVPNIARLATCLCQAGGTVAWVLPSRNGPSPVAEEFLGPEVAELYRRPGGEGPLRERLWHEFEVSDDDVSWRSRRQAPSSLADANAARRNQNHNATLYTIYRSFGDVRPTTGVISLIQAGRRSGLPNG